MNTSDLAPTVDQVEELTDQELQVLAFERGWWKYVGAKETAIREQFGFSATRYYQLLGVIINKPGALAADPTLVNRLRRLRAARQARREGRAAS